MKKVNNNNLDERTKSYRKLLDQIIVEVKDTSIEEHEEPFRSWLKKNHIILEDIGRLKSDRNDRSKVSAFLLETQFIEFKLMDLLQELQILVNTDPNIINLREKKDTRELYKLTLGELSKELCKYNADFLNKIKPLVDVLNEKRIRFAHYLFTSIKGIEDVIKDAQAGLTHNEKVFGELYSVFEYIKKNTWYGQMYERKRVKEFSGKKI